MTLAISATLKLPPEALTETFAVLGKRGSGKTNFGVVLVEELVAAGWPVCVIDPVGVWWGLRSSADGKSAGLPVTILGGEHADVPLEIGAGAVVADFVIESRQPCVLDLSTFRKGEQTTFMTAFAERLYHAKATNRDPLHVVVDEADAYAPQRAMPNEARLVGAMEDLVRRGRSRGLGLTLITQRPAALHKGVLTQAEVLVVFRMTGPHDRRAIEEWTMMHGEKAQQRDLMESLTDLPVGTCWLWSPGWLGHFGKVAIRERRTFDSSATPKAGARRAAPSVLAPVDLKTLQARMAETIARANEDDPKALRARIKELEAGAVERVPEAVRRFLVDAGRSLTTIADDLTEAAHQLAKLAEAGAMLGLEIDDAEPAHVPVRVDAGPGATAVAHVSPRISPRSMRAVEGVTRAAAKMLRAGDFDTNNGRTNFDPVAEAAARGKPDPRLGKCERAILTVLVQHGTLTRDRLAILANYSSGGGGFGNSLGALRTAGRVDGTNDAVRLLDAGRTAIGTVPPLPPKGPARRDFWMGMAGGKAGRAILEVIIMAHPKPLTREEIGERAGYAADGGGFGNALGRLRSLGVIAGKNDAIRLTDELA